MRGFACPPSCEKSRSASATPPCIATARTVSRLQGLQINLAGTAQDLLLGKVGSSGTAISYNPAGQIGQIVRTATSDVYAWSDHANATRNYTRNGLNQYLTAGTASFTYDARGNLTSDGTNSYTYSSENYLLTGPGSSTFSYDPLGRLYQSVGGGVTTRRAYDGQALIAEYNSANALQRRFVYGPGVDTPIVWYEGTGTADRRWLQADERGSVVALSNDAGTSIGINRYDDYGIAASTNMGRFQYTGQTWLPEIGMYYYKARIYSPTLGRFLQTDPIGYGDGMNMYAYVGNDPINGTDPSGMTAYEACTGSRLCLAHLNRDGSSSISFGGAYVSSIAGPSSGGKGHVGQICVTCGLEISSTDTGTDLLVPQQIWIDAGWFAGNWGASGLSTRDPTPQNNGLSRCSMGQKAGQWIGGAIGTLGAVGTNIGLGTTAVGAVTTGAGIGIGATGNLPTGLAVGFFGLGLIDRACSASMRRRLDRIRSPSSSSARSTMPSLVRSPCRWAMWASIFPIAGSASVRTRWSWARPARTRAASRP